ncbi:MAG TPA: hypothetical protein VGW12_05315 [Pyrinomonadaceae bacterium]|nr:hypothetical protein [Pyrinomonadaceae bacterium]
MGLGIFFDNTDPGTGGWLVLVAWFVLFVLVLNTVVFLSRRLFRRLRGKSEMRHGEKRA